MTLPHDCEEFRRGAEFWDSVDEGTTVATDCPDCQNEWSRVHSEADQLRSHFAAVAIPEMPRQLPLREGMQAASGHPRRVSTNVLPIAWLVALLVLLGVLYFLGEILRRAFNEAS
ncbi:MAG: hypothetical protein AAF488_17815 [Planctomycetota bacterium]